MKISNIPFCCKNERKKTVKAITIYLLCVAKTESNKQTNSQNISQKSIC